MNHLLTTAELATLLGVTTQTIRNRHSKQPESLPCAYRFGNMRRVLFRSEEVEQFLQARKNVANAGQERNKK